jgi:hypothetical protein
MKQKAVNSATYAVTIARDAIGDFGGADNLLRQRKAWWHFLQASSAVYEKLKVGATQTGGATYGWWSRVVKERREDQLLNYIHQARNCSHHGIEEFTEDVGGSVQIGPLSFNYDPDENRSFTEETDQFSERRGTLYINGVAVTEKEAVATGLFRRHKSALVLTPVTNDHYGDTFSTADEHLGDKIDGRDPLVVGKAALEYYRNLLTAAQYFVS